MGLYYVIMARQVPYQCPHCHSSNIYYCGLGNQEDKFADDMNWGCRNCDYEFMAGAPSLAGMVCPHPGCGSKKIEFTGIAGRYECAKCQRIFQDKRPLLGHRPEPKPEPDERQVFEANAVRLGLDPSWFGRTFTYRGESFEVAGLSLRSPKMPVLLTNRSRSSAMRSTVVFLQQQFGVLSTPRSREDVAAKTLAQMGDRMGLKPEWVGRIFTLNGRRVKFLGVKPRARAMPVQLQVVDTGEYRKCAIEYFLGAIDTMEPIATPQMGPHAAAAAPATPERAQPADAESAPPQSPR